MTWGQGDAEMGRRGDAENRARVSARLLLVLVITAVALLLRLRAVFLLPIDADEPTYMAVATEYAADLRAGNLGAIVAYDKTLEHPALAKLLYGVQLAIMQPADSDVGLHMARGLSVVFGTLQVLLLALLNPLAGFALAVHTMTIKYTSQVYLEAVPGFFAIASIVAFERYRQRPPTPNAGGGRRDDPLAPNAGGGRRDDPLAPNAGGGRRDDPLAPNAGGEESRFPQHWGGRGAWLAISAVCLGATAAGKYPYLAVGLALAPFLPWKERNWRAIGAFVAIALATFFMLDVSLWADPLGRLLRSLSFHPAYSQSSQVTRYGFEWWKPLDYLLHPAPWHPGVFFLGLDGWIFVLGLLGLPILWLRSRPYVVWALVGLAVVLIWPTKWPQYTLIVIPPLCLSLGYAAVDLARWADNRFQLQYYLAPFFVPRSTVILAATAGLALAVVLFLEGFIRWQEALGWQQFSTHNSGLVDDYVQALAEDARGVSWVGTHNGLASFDGETWTVYTAETGALPSDNVQALAIALDNTIWVGTDHGLAAFDGAAWRQFHAGDPGGGPAGDDVRGLAAAPDGRLWAASSRGVSVFDGRVWTSYVAGSSALPGELVYCVAVTGDRIWVGTNAGVAVFDPRTQGWQHYDLSNSGLRWNAVSTIAVAPDGRIWLGTMGGGVSSFDGQTWTAMTTGNSGLPWNTVVAIAASPQGDIWVAADLPNAAGGNVARFNGQTWKTFTPVRSGIASGAATTIAINSQGRVVIGMRGAGISIYTPH